MTFSIAPASRTTLAVSSASVGYGQSLTLTATVATWPLRPQVERGVEGRTAAR